MVLADRLTVLYALGTYAIFIGVPWLQLVVLSRSFAPLRPASSEAPAIG
jgi:hypothetical protein